MKVLKKYSRLKLVQYYAHLQMIAWALAGLVICISLLSHTLADNSWFYFSSDSTRIANMCGILGAHISALLLYIFGATAFGLFVVCFFIAYNLGRHKSLSQEWDRIGALFILMCVYATFFNMYNADFLAGSYPGGLIGHLIKSFLHTMIDEEMVQSFLYILLCICFLILLRFAGMKYVHRVFIKAAALLKTNGIWKKGAHFCYQLPLNMVSFYSRIHAYVSQYFTHEDSASFNDYEQMMQDHEVLPANFSWNSFTLPAMATTLPLDVPEEKISPVSEEEFKVSGEEYQVPNLAMFVEDSDPEHDAKLSLELKKCAKILEEKLERFGISGSVVSIKKGPVVTLFEYKPAIDVKISKIIALEDDLALALLALSIRIIAPMPGKSVIGFEIANKNRKMVSFACVVHSSNYADSSLFLPLILGQDIVGTSVVVDLAAMPHLLVAGSTGSGKSVALNVMLMSLLCKRKPKELKFILIDPKRLEFASYADIAHLLFPIITETKKVVPVLNWVVGEMERRYKMLADKGARNINDYNVNCPHDERLPYIVVMIDELADVIMTAGRPFEDLLARIAQMSRAAGIHMIIATQRPSVDVITGLIKVNFPSRISCRVTSKIDSRTILDCTGAEKLLGRGDMLFLDVQDAQLKRIHGAYVSHKEILNLVAYIRKQSAVSYLELPAEITDIDVLGEADDALYKDVLSFIKAIDEVSISLLQRKFRIGYNRSARIIDMLEAQGLIMPSESGKTRKVIK